jgi:hypothetical protein
MERSTVPSSHPRLPRAAGRASGLFVLALGAALAASAGARASALVYQLSGYGSFEEPGGGNSAGEFVFTFTGGSSSAGNDQSPLNGTLQFFPYSYGPSPVYTLSDATDLELNPSSTPPYLFGFSLPSVTTYIELSDASLSSDSLASPFSVTVALTPLQEGYLATPISVGGGQYATLETFSSDVTFSAAAAVPEAATWAMMLIGLGGLGVTLRARRISLA